MEIPLSCLALYNARVGKIPKRQRKPLHLAEWFEAFGVEPKDHNSIGHAIGYSGSYIKNLIQPRTDDPSANRRENPSTDLLIKLSEFFGVTVNDFHRLPSRKDVLRAMANLSPAARQILLREK